MHIGRKLRYLIENEGLSKKDLAKRLDTSEQNLHKILGKESIQTRLLVDFCKELKVHPGIFFSEYELNDPKSASPLQEEEQEYGSSAILGKEVRLYERLLEEKDEHIKTLQKLISLYDKG